MKKSFLKIALGAVICLAAGYTVYNVQSKNGNLSVLELANVEALAQIEIPEVVIQCSSGNKGTCFTYTDDVCWDVTRRAKGLICKFTGSMSDFCTNPCP